MDIFLKKFIDCLKFFPDKSQINSVLAFCLLGVGIIAAVLILTVLGKTNPPKHSGLFRRVHRICGYIFFAFYLFICSIMFQKLMGFTMLPPKATIHSYIGIIIFPMIIAKICIVRFYRKFYTSLPIFGMIIISVTYLQIPLYAGLDIFTAMKNHDATLFNNERLVWLEKKIGQEIACSEYSICPPAKEAFPYAAAEAFWKNYVLCPHSKDSEILPMGYFVKNQVADCSGKADGKVDEWMPRWE